MNLKLRIWRQRNKDSNGAFQDYLASDVSPDMSFLEMLDFVNLDLVKKGQDPIAFDHDCREGICGMCSVVINGDAHGPEKLTTTCQLHMRHYKDGDIITIEPFKAKAFPIIKDLMVDRSAFDRIMAAGGYVSVNTGSAPDANSIPVGKKNAEISFEAATCIGCGACVATCKNASASLFVSAKLGHLAHLPQGSVESSERTLAMVAAMDQEGFGSCSNTGACEAACPKGIRVAFIAKMNREFVRSSLCS